MKQSEWEMDLIFFMVGGRQFCARVDGLETIAASDWQPRAETDNIVDLRHLLDLPEGEGSRVLVLHTRDGRVGMRVDEISTRMIGRHRVQPIPPSLSAWLHIQALQGIASDPMHGIIPVLDLDKLAQVSAKSS